MKDANCAMICVRKNIAGLGMIAVNASTDNVCFLSGTPEKCQPESSVLSMITNASVQLTLVNGCPYAIFVAGAVQVNLTAGATETKNVPKVSSAQRLWANTDCDKPNNPLCSLSAAMPPISLFEWTFDADGKQTYDVSYVDGANVPISVQVPNCPSVTYDSKLGNSLDQLADAVPDAMKMVDSNGRKRVKSVCLAYGTDSVCCRNAHDQPETCGPTHDWTSDQIAGYNAMRAAFPTSYSYAYDDRIATEVCWSGTSFRIGFCTN
uniref:VWFD domain-containing protein n=1 Tax=Globodera pallida TaxID=36090 RepID=A0A183BMV7_GLOPA